MPRKKRDEIRINYNKSHIPGFIRVGSNVSAKFKGAFCSAVVEGVVEKNIVCQLYFHQNCLGNQNVNDQSIVEGKLEAGEVVNAKHPSSSDPLRATILMLTDKSKYGVVFSDGDRVTVKRSQIIVPRDANNNCSDVSLLSASVAAAHTVPVGSSAVTDQGSQTGSYVKEEAASPPRVDEPEKMQIDGIDVKVDDEPEGAQIGGIDIKVSDEPEGAQIGDITDKFADEPEGAQIGGIEAKIESEGAQIGGIEDKIESEGAQIGGIEDKIESEGAQIGGIEDKIESEGAQIGGIEDKIESEDIKPELEPLVPNLTIKKVDSIPCMPVPVPVPGPSCSYEMQKEARANRAVPRKEKKEKKSKTNRLVPRKDETPSTSRANRLMSRKEKAIIDDIIENPGGRKLSPMEYAKYMYAVVNSKNLPIPDITLPCPTGRFNFIPKTDKVNDSNEKMALYKKAMFEASKAHYKTNKKKKKFEERQQRKSARSGRSHNGDPNAPPKQKKKKRSKEEKERSKEEKQRRKEEKKEERNQRRKERRERREKKARKRKNKAAAQNKLPSRNNVVVYDKDESERNSNLSVAGNSGVIEPSVASEPHLIAVEMIKQEVEETNVEVAIELGIHKKVEIKEEMEVTQEVDNDSE